MVLPLLAWRVLLGSSYLTVGPRWAGRPVARVQGQLVLEGSQPAWSPAFSAFWTGRSGTLGYPPNAAQLAQLC